MFNILKPAKKEPENIKEVLGEIKKIAESLEKIKNELENLKEKSRFAVQKTGIIRFNPFNEVGGDQSFSIAMLDENDNGLVITSLYTREGNRIYAKPIERGVSKYQLSEEEKTVIERAKSSQILNSKS